MKKGKESKRVLSSKATVPGGGAKGGGKSGGNMAGGGRMPSLPGSNRPKVR